MTRSDEPRVPPRVCTAPAHKAQQAASKLLGRHAILGVDYTTMPLGKVFQGHVLVVEELPGAVDGEEGEEGEEGKVIEMIMEIINASVAGFSSSICSRL